MQRLDIFMVFTWRLLLYCKLTKQHPLDIWDGELFETDFFQKSVPNNIHALIIIISCTSVFILDILTWCVCDGNMLFHFESLYSYIVFFFSNTWPSWFAENHFCTRLQSFNKYCHHVLDVVNWGFIKNIVKSRIFNAHFFEKHPLILKNGPT